jgi:exoribonuclease-2
MRSAKPPFDLGAVAKKAMVDHGFHPDLPEAATRQLNELAAPDWEAPASVERQGTHAVRDMTGFLWSSIDNRESRDLDQIEYVEPRGGEGGSARVYVGIADVDVLVGQGTPLDLHAAENTASVYTGVLVFSMLPERLSTDLTSLNFGEARLALVVAFDVADGGQMGKVDVFRARVRNHARLSYDEVGAWLGGGPLPASVGRVGGLEEQLRVQDRVARALQSHRYEKGALDLETIEARPVAKDGSIVDLALTEKSRSREIIEDFMIAANGAMARFLETNGRASIRRVVRAPLRWQRIVDLAKTLGEELPDQPNAPALAHFLSRRKAEDPKSFGELSLSVVKLMGPGEYALERPGAPHVGHFGLAVQDYTHSTAPNRRFADLVTQRLIKAIFRGGPQPYSDDELGAIATRCTDRENQARKVERFMRKVGAALLLSDRIGDEFDAIVTGVGAKGTFVRVIAPPAEGRLVRGEAGLDVGDTLKVRLTATEPRLGFIDFVRAREDAAAGRPH